MGHEKPEKLEKQVTFVNIFIYIYIYCFKHLFFYLVTVITSYKGNKRLCSENLNFKVMRGF